MRIVEVCSHLNGEEHLLIHHAELYDEVKSIIERVDAQRCRTSKGKRRPCAGRRYTANALNREFKGLFAEVGWQSVQYDYYVTTDRTLLDRIIEMPLDRQKDYLEEHGVEEPIRSHKQTDFVKDQVAIEVQFGKYAFVAYDLFVKHLLFYTGGVIDVGIEVLPMKEMLADPEGGRRMSTGIAYFEGEVYNVMRHGRSSPPVPLVIIGIAP